MPSERKDKDKGLFFSGEPAVRRWQEDDDGLFGIGLFSLQKDTGSGSIEYTPVFWSHLTPHPLPPYPPTPDWSSYTIYHWLVPVNILSLIICDIWGLQMVN